MPLDGIAWGVPWTDLDRAWPCVETLIERATATSRGKETAFDIRRALGSRDAQLWCFKANADAPISAVAVTEIVNYPRRRVLRIRICTGEDRERWQAGLLALEDWARGQGCAGCEFIARPGWGRVLKAHGYETTHHVVEKDL